MTLLLLNNENNGFLDSEGAPCNIVLIAEKAPLTDNAGISGKS